jgi:hypothetical protein
MADLRTNRISFSLPEDDLQAILDAILTLKDKLLPRLVDLDATARHQLPKMGPRSLEFVSETLAIARAHPQFMPACLDLDEFARDFEAVTLLGRLLRPLSEITDLVDDSRLLSGSEAYVAALAAYQAIQSAAKLGHPGAAQFADALSARFPGRRPKAAAAPATGPDAAAGGDAAP